MQFRNALTGFCALLAVSACDVDRATSPVGTHNPPSYDYTWGPYTLVPGNTWSDLEISTRRVIGPNGGTVHLLIHELVVPKGAVSAPTVFRMAKKLGPHVVVDLEATDQKSGAAVTDFAQPVELRLSYRLLLVHPKDLDRLSILWLKDGNESGELVPVPTHVDRKTKHIVGSLTHFSRYAMGMN